MDSDSGASPDAGEYARLLRARAATTPLWVDVDGDSMEPVLRAPARVLVGPLSRPRVGEVWVFVDRDRLLRVHRCLHRRLDGDWVFRGDSADRTDSPVSLDRLVGPVHAAEDIRGTGEVPRSRSVAVRSSLRRAVGWFRAF